MKEVAQYHGENTESTLKRLNANVKIPFEVKDIMAFKRRKTYAP